MVLDPKEAGLLLSPQGQLLFISDLLFYSSPIKDSWGRDGPSRFIYGFYRVIGKRTFGTWDSFPGHGEGQGWQRVVVTV